MSRTGGVFYEDAYVNEASMEEYETNIGMEKLLDAGGRYFAVH